MYFYQRFELLDTEDFMPSQNVITLHVTKVITTPPCLCHFFKASVRVARHREIIKSGVDQTSIFGGIAEVNGLIFLILCLYIHS